MVTVTPRPDCNPTPHSDSSLPPSYHHAHCQVLVHRIREVRARLDLTGNGGCLWSAARTRTATEWEATLTRALMVTVAPRPNCNPTPHSDSSLPPCTTMHTARCWSTASERCGPALTSLAMGTACGPAARTRTATEWEATLARALMVTVTPRPNCNPTPHSDSSLPPSYHHAHCQVLVNRIREVRACLAITGNGGSLWSAARTRTATEWEVTLTRALMVTVAPHPNCNPTPHSDSSLPPCTTMHHCQVLVHRIREVQACLDITGNGGSLWSAARTRTATEWEVTLTRALMVTGTPHPNCNPTPHSDSSLPPCTTMHTARFWSTESERCGPALTSLAMGAACGLQHGRALPQSGR